VQPSVNTAFKIHPICLTYDYTLYAYSYSLAGCSHFVHLDPQVLHLTTYDQATHRKVFAGPFKTHALIMYKEGMAESERIELESGEW
jgi:hypothetical protein